MRIACLGTDRGGWGQTIAALAESRGYRAQVFERAEEVSRANAPDYVFMRIPQFPPALEAGIRAYGALLDRHDSVMIPDLDTVRMYEDKIAQAKHYKSWMPETWINEINPDDQMPEIPVIEFLHNATKALGFPFIAKASFGSASANVRLIETHKQAVDDLVNGLNVGIPARRGGAALQKGHVIWQKFLPDNAYDYRAVITGRYVMLLRRYNRDDRPMASGSGKTEAIENLGLETMVVLQRAFQFFKANDIKFGGIDLVCDHGKWAGVTDAHPQAKGIARLDPTAWMVLETTLGWSQRAYSTCRYFTESLGHTRYQGREMFDLILDEIEAGVWE